MSIYDKIKAGEYQSKLPIPAWPKVYCPSCGYTILTQKYCPECGTYVKQLRAKAFAGRDRAIKIRSKDVDRLMDKFSEDLAVEFGVQDKPKRHLLFEKCIDLSNKMSGGLKEVAAFYEELVDLIR